MPALPLTANATTAAATAVIAAPGAKRQIRLRKGTVSNRGAAARRVLLAAAGSPARWQATLAVAGTVAFDFGKGWDLANNTALNVLLDAAGNVDINITDWDTVDAA